MLTSQALLALPVLLGQQVLMASRGRKARRAAREQQESRDLQALQESLGLPEAQAEQAELEAREGAIAIPFLRMADEIDFPPDELVVHAIKQGVGLFRKTPRAAVDSQTSTRYNGEYFLRVLSPEERTQLEYIDLRIPNRVYYKVK